MTRSPQPIAKRRRLTVGNRLVVAAMVALGGAILAPLPAYAAACASTQSSDFNGDGFSDAAVADPYATVAGVAQAGRVVVLYGAADGRIGEGSTRQTVNQGAAMVSGSPESSDRFGFALASADLDGDGCHDLVVGSPYEDSGSNVDSGLVQVIYGDPGGLGVGRPSRDLTQTFFGEVTRAGDQFGYSVDALDDVFQGGTSDPEAYALGIGAPGFDVSGRNDAGWAGFLAATDGAISSMDATQDTPGVPGVAEAGDRFGSAVSINNLVREGGTVDAAVGVPGEDVGAATNAGAVTILADLYDRIETGVGFDQDSPGVAGSAETGDQFGRNLDTVRVGDTTHLVVGVPGEDVGNQSNAGAVQLFRSANRTTVTPLAGLSQDTAGVSGVAEAGDLFGDDVTFGTTGTPANTQVQLAVGAASEDGAAVNSGAVWVFPLNNLDAETVYTQDSSGMPGGVDANDRFGSSLAVVRGASERALLIGVPDDVDLPSGMVNVVPFGGATKRYWAPGVNGIPAAGASRFGDTIASSSD